MGLPGDAPVESTPAALAASRRSFDWAQIRSLTARHRPRMLAHLLALDEKDRYLRFGYDAEDEQIRRYVERIVFERDDIFGIFNHRLELVALAHLAYEPQVDTQAATGAEFGVSVAVRARGRGFGARLFDHAVLRARSRRVETVVIHALAENGPMLRIVRAAGAVIEVTGGDSEARLKLPPEALASPLPAAAARAA